MPKSRRTTRTRVTMDDVARVAGVSRATVSRVLADHASVSEDTRAKVLKAIEETGYVLNYAAQSLAGDIEHRPTIVGVLLRDPRNSAYGLLHSRLQEACDDVGIHLVTVTPVKRGGVADEYSAVQSLLGLGVHGIFLATGTLRPSDIEHFLNTVPMIAVGRPELHDEISVVGYDEDATGILLADHILAFGHRDIAVMVTDVTGSVPEHHRSTSMVRRLRSVGANVIEVPNPQRYNSLQAQQAMLELVRSGQVTAAMFPNDAKAFTFMQMCSNQGIRIPDDVSIVGADGTTRELQYVGLSTVRIPVETVAHRAATMMKDRISRPTQPVQHETFPGVLVQGTSVGSPAR